MEESNQERKCNKQNEKSSLRTSTEDRHQMGRIQKITKIKEKKTVDR